MVVWSSPLSPSISPCAPPPPSLLMQDATLNAAAGKYAGLDRFKARKALWADMEAEGLVIKKDNYTMRWVCWGGRYAASPAAPQHGVRSYAVELHGLICSARTGTACTIYSAYSIPSSF